MTFYILGDCESRTKMNSIYINLYLSRWHPVSKFSFTSLTSQRQFHGRFWTLPEIAQGEKKNAWMFQICWKTNSSWFRAEKPDTEFRRGTVAKSTHPPTQPAKSTQWHVFSLPLAASQVSGRLSFESIFSSFLSEDWQIFKRKKRKQGMIWRNSAQVQLESTVFWS